MRISRALIPFAFVFTAACEPATQPTPGLPGLASQVWVAASVDGQPLPRIVAQRQLEGDVLEYDILDALFVTIDSAGYWEQRAFVRRFRDGALHAALEIGAEGSWAAEPSGYVFATDESNLAFLVSETIADSFTATIGVEGVTPGVSALLVKPLN